MHSIRAKKTCEVINDLHATVLSSVFMTINQEGLGLREHAAAPRQSKAMQSTISCRVYEVRAVVLVK